MVLSIVLRNAVRVLNDLVAWGFEEALEVGGLLNISSLRYTVFTLSVVVMSQYLGV